MDDTNCVGLDTLNWWEMLCNRTSDMLCEAICYVGVEHAVSGWTCRSVACDMMQTARHVVLVGHCVGCGSKNGVVLDHVGVIWHQYNPLVISVRCCACRASLVLNFCKKIQSLVLSVVFPIFFLRSVMQHRGFDEDHEKEEHRVLISHETHSRTLRFFKT